jgi:hypothetical protein
MDIKQSKSILARLLAKENLTVQHKNIPTAYFDTKNRLLALPTWKDMSSDLYDLLTGHEVGHALYTPSQGWHDQIHDKDFGNHFKGFLNVLEDARIEKLIKRTYPGLRKNFYQAYKELFDKDFFGVNDMDLDDLLFIDRVNLHFKLGSFLAVDFTPEEAVIVNEIAKMETWEEVVALARRMYDMAREELEQKKEMLSKGDIMEYEMKDASEGDDEAQGEGEFDEVENLSQDVSDQITEMTEPESLTDKAFRNRETELLDEKSLPFHYYNIQEFDAAPFIWNYKTMLSIMNFVPEQEARRGEIYTAFKAKNLKFVNYLVKEFELRRNAQQMARAQVSKSGEIDVKKLFKYQISEDLFLKVTSIPKGKNHGLVMFYDMSGSMSTSIAGVIEQILILVEFCRKINIPFEVYGFTNDSRSFWDNNGPQTTYRDSFADRKHIGAEGDLCITSPEFRLQQYFSNTMSATEYKKMVSNLCMVIKTWNNNRGGRGGVDYDYNWPGIMPACEHLHSTPLTSTIALTRNIFNRFKARTGAEVVNMVFLTDGESDGDMRARSFDKAGLPDTSFVEAGWRCNSFITDTKTKISIQLRGRQTSRALTTGLLEMTRAVTGCNIVGFFLTNNVKNTVTGEIVQTERWMKHHDAAEDAQVAKVMEEFKRDRVAVLTTSGYNEYYVVKNDLSFSDEFEVEANADARDIGKAFRKMQRGKLLNRVLLNRFIRMIA